jgi:hypothetical protein
MIAGPLNAKDPEVILNIPFKMPRLPVLDMGPGPLASNHVVTLLPLSTTMFPKTVGLRPVMNALV